MFGLSVCDILGSIAMALTSLPMPREMPREEDFGYVWNGVRLGNTDSCNAQGFIVTFGMLSTYGYNAMLCLYYACAITFGMKERSIEKFVEPILHALPLMFALVYATLPLFYDLYNPSVTNFAWCGLTPYPATCVREEYECVRGGSGQYIIKLLGPMSIGILFVIIIGSLTSVLWKVLMTRRLLTKLSNNYANYLTETEIKQLMSKLHDTKAIFIQALAYITAFLLGICPLFLRAIRVVNAYGDSKEDFDRLASVDKITYFFTPLQGFFNLIIFVSHKVYNYRRVNEDESICNVLLKLFLTPIHDPCFISRISIVQKNEPEEVVRCHSYESVEDSRVLEVKAVNEAGLESSYIVQVLRSNAMVEGASCQDYQEEHVENSNDNEMGNTAEAESTPFDDLSYPTNQSAAQSIGFQLSEVTKKYRRY